MKLALIPPIELLEYTDQTSCQLALPHLLESSEAYRYVYQKHCEDQDQFVILDNGAAEDVPCSPERLMELAYLIMVDEVVVPDVMYDRKLTIEAAQEFRDKYMIDGFQYMFVAQGSNQAEAQLAIDFASGQPWIKTIGLPRHLIETCESPGIRSELAHYVMRKQRSQKVHLLGGAPSYPQEIKHQRWPKCVRSTDTSAPFNFAYAGKTFRSGNICKRPSNYFNLPIEAFNEHCLEKNIKNLIAWSGE